MPSILQGNVEMNLKMLVDAIESFYEGELAKRFDAQENVEDLDFTVQFAKISEQLQWVRILLSSLAMN